MDYSERKGKVKKQTNWFSLELFWQKHTITGSPLCPSTWTHCENVSWVFFFLNDWINIWHSGILSLNRLFAKVWILVRTEVMRLEETSLDRDILSSTPVIRCLTGSSLFPFMCRTSVNSEIGSAFWSSVSWSVKWGDHIGWACWFHPTHTLDNPFPLRGAWGSWMWWNNTLSRAYTEEGILHMWCFFLF